MGRSGASVGVGVEVGTAVGSMSCSGVAVGVGAEVGAGVAVGAGAEVGAGVETGTEAGSEESLSATGGSAMSCPLMPVMENPAAITLSMVISSLFS